MQDEQNSAAPHASTNVRWCFTLVAVALLWLGAFSFWKPEILALRIRPIETRGSMPFQSGAVAVLGGLALPCLLAGLVGLIFALRRQAPARSRGWLVAIATALAYVSLQAVFADWTVDDAAITFAYSENLVAGHGLVLHPSHAPEEAYSSTLWMLALALARALGFELELAAKLFGLACGAACTVLTMWACVRVLGKGAEYGSILLCAVVALGAPFVIWSCSGLEHALQALLLAVVATLPMFTSRAIVPTAACLGALMLLRPETPLIVLATTAAYAADCWKQGPRALLRLWPLILVPVAVGIGLEVFRLSYFGAAFPNPYYAKASSATFLRVLNLLGKGWGYVLDWLASSGAFVLIPLILLGVTWRSTLAVRLALAMAVAQIGFILYVGGDWMGCYRFVAPILPLLAIVVAGALAVLRPQLGPTRIEIMALGLAGLLGIGTTVGLLRFRLSPTTPTSVVTAIGREFVSLANRLGVEHPSLAHNDAGGTSWGAGIDLVDLGGLGCRAIALHMDDANFLRQYLFVERRPTFIFGSTTAFAAGRSRFHELPEFGEQYVPVRFTNKPYMEADLCHIRRDAIRPAAGVTPVLEAGQLVAISVVD